MSRRSRASWVLMLVWLVSVSGYAAAAEVVYKGSDTISTVPFYSAIRQKTESSVLGKKPLLPDGNPHLLRNRIPIRSSTLRPGQPRIVEQEHQQPVFIMGGDLQSLEWFEREAAHLGRLGAVGVVIALESEGEWSRIQRIARQHRLIVHTVDGDAIAEAYRIDTYPTLIVGEGALGQ
ncbi:MAG: integrating conjugative element protein [Pseudomonadota bacterium]